MPVAAPIIQSGFQEGLGLEDPFAVGDLVKDLARCAE